MIPPLTDLVALLGIDLVLCAGLLQLLRGWHGVASGAKWVAAACFVFLWIPVGAAHLPILAYIRGVSSDLSITLVGLAYLSLCRGLPGMPAIAGCERTTLLGVVALAALFLYPTALGWGDWDAYRAGWGSTGMWLALLALSCLFWSRGLRLLPMLVGAALLAWSGGLMESTNLWDYLMDPWLAMAALVQCLRTGIHYFLRRFRRAGPGAQALPP